MSEKKQNIYSKLAKARVMLQSLDVKKSGKNKHLGFSYMELTDFLPEINKINDELGIISIFSITPEGATMALVDSENTESTIVFASPIAQAKLQGNASPIQELGAQHTYMRRYMFLMAYEICESDAMDAAIGDPKKPKTNDQDTAEESVEVDKIANSPISVIKQKTITELASKCKVDIQQILGFCNVDNIEKITEKQFSGVMTNLNVTLKKLEAKNQKHADII